MKRSAWLLLTVLVASAPALAEDRTAAVAPPTAKLVAMTLLVRDYDKAANWYSENLGFEIRDNKDLRPGKRWVAMFPKGAPVFQIFLLKPGDGYMPVAKNLSKDRVGKETFWILHTPDLEAFVNHLQARGVKCRSETYDMPNGGKEIVIEDLYGNLWVLQQVGVKSQ